MFDNKEHYKFDLGVKELNIKEKNICYWGKMSPYFIIKPNSFSSVEKQTGGFYTCLLHQTNSGTFAYKL